MATYKGLAAARDRLSRNWRERQTARPILTPSERDRLGLLFFAGLILLVDRLSNAAPVLRPIDGIVYLVAIFCLACWAGFRCGLGACVVLVGYVWLIYRFPSLSSVAVDRRYLSRAVWGTAIVYPPFAIIGGFVHGLLRRAARRVLHAQAEADRASEQRRLAEAELWASEEMRRLIVDSSIDAVIGIASDRTITLWSPNAEKLFGWTRAEAIGYPAASRIVAPLPAPPGGSEILAFEEPDRLPVLRRQVETTAQTKSGEPVAVELYVVDHASDAGTMYVVFARDIGERKRAEQMIRELNANLRELNAGLEGRVAERTRQLETANEELLGFTYSVSHDLRAPLRAIVSNSRIVCEDAEGLLNEELLGRLRRLENGALKMAELIDNLLQYARIGQVGMTSCEIDLSAMAARIAADLQALRDGTVAIEPGIVVEGDPGMIEMVVTNLLENAWKYVKPDHEPRVEVGTTSDGAVFVRDHGIGFDMKYVDKVWEPFERLHTESEYPGTGIGLANSKRIVDRHGGRMWAESAPGHGTTIFFDLGRPPHRETPARASLAPEADVLGG